MLYRIGTVTEISTLPKTVPRSVIEHLQYCIAILDDAYGAERDYLQVGGYALIAESADDVSAIREIFDLDRHLTEWVQALDGGFLSALFLLSDDYAIVTCLPFELAPRSLQEKLED